jgi:hypothetical protein
VLISLRPGGQDDTQNRIARLVKKSVTAPACIPLGTSSLGCGESARKKLRRQLSHAEKPRQGEGWTGNFLSLS